MSNYACFLASLTLYVKGIFSNDGIIFIAAALFALASNVEIKINTGEHHD